MANFFSPEGKLYQFMTRLYDILKLNFLWILCSLPIITVGVSTIAAFTITLRMVENTEGNIAIPFFKAFKQNLKQGIPMTFITILGAWAVYLNFEVFRVAESAFFLITAIISGYIVTFSLIYAFPLLARYENTVVKTLVNSFRISMRYFFRSVFVAFIFALGVVLMSWSATTMLVGLLIGPASIFLAMSGPAMSVFRKIEAENSGNTENIESTKDAKPD